MSDVDITVWYAVLPTELVNASDAFARHLTPEECARADRFFFDGDKSLFTLSHALLRHALQVQTDFSSWETRTGRNGKPELVPTGRETSVHFNLSRTDQLVCCAISSSHPVGVDAESTGKITDFSTLAEHYYSQMERDYLLSCRSLQREVAFLQIWTIKEAVSKAIGAGLAMPFADLWVTLDPVSLSFAPHLKLDATKWQIEQFKPTPKHQIALAVQRPVDRHLSVAWQSVDLANF